MCFAYAQKIVLPRQNHDNKFFRNCQGGEKTFRAHLLWL